MTFEETFSFEHLLDCANDCLRGVTWKESVQMFGINILQWTAMLHKELLSGTYRSRGFHHFTICERGKRREISSVHISERCVQKCLVKYALKPAVVPKVIYDNAATLEGRGTEFAIKRLREHLRWHLARHGKQGGILTVDYHNYFGSIVHDRLLEMIRPLLDDDRVFGIAEYFIRCFPGSVGLGLGSEISQICAVLYPNSIDHLMKDRLRVHGYGRYMDDSYAISHDMGLLREYRNIISEKAAGLGLKLNEKMTQITRFDGGHFIYLKKRTFITEDHRIVMRLTPKNITRRRRTARKHAAMVADGRMSPEAQMQSFNSWKGYAEKYNSYTTIKRLEMLLDSPNVF